ncbi:MAG: hypothetical protein Q8868_06265 [Bacteroidota bacterium]|nr:hypothetical protein [Bacteroidota bacterium]
MSLKYFLSLLILYLLTIDSSSRSFRNGHSFTWQTFALQDTLPDNQSLYNGRVWRNIYPDVRGDQFLFIKTFLPGSVTMRGKTFNNIKLRYDILDDELLTLGNRGGVLQLNKEMVDSFDILFKDGLYKFVKLSGDSLTEPAGYCNLLYNGDHALYVKYRKKIGKLAEEGKYDSFYQVTRIFVFEKGTFHPVSSKKDLLELSGNMKDETRAFIRKNNLVISRESPASFIPVLRYLDTMK